MASLLNSVQTLGHTDRTKMKKHTTRCKSELGEYGGRVDDLKELSAENVRLNYKKAIKKTALETLEYTRTQ